MKNKSTLRKCVGCGQIKERSDLIKIIKTHDTCEIIVMPDSKHFGRSSYLCYNKECLKNALKKRRLQRSLKKEISEATWSCLESVINQVK